MVRPSFVVLAVALAGCRATSPEESSRDATEVQRADETPITSVALWLADRDAGQIAQVRVGDAVAGSIDVLAADLDAPTSVRRGQDGALYVTTYSPSGVARVVDGEATTFFTDSYLEEPVELAFRGDELFVLGNDTGNVVVSDAAGHFVREFGYPQMRHAHDMAFGLDGLLYVATSYSIALEGGVQKWDADSGELVGVFASEDEVGRATGLAFDEQGWLYVADSMHGIVARFDAASGTLEEIPLEGLEQPLSLAIQGGDLFVADRTGVHRFALDSSAAGSGEHLAVVASADEVERVRGVTLAH